VKIVQADEHPARKVDPFGLLPCDCDRVVVHISDSESMGDDLVECMTHRYVVTLGELYRGIFPGRGAS
jgi:hypothetical protein